MSTGREIRLIETDDGEWSAVDENSGVTGTGDAREEALSNLDAETPSSDEDAPLGDRLRGMVGDVDVNLAESVRDIRERT